MAEFHTELARPSDPLGRALFLCAYLCTLIGGFLMAVMTVMTVCSVLGRYFISAPIPGDFELVTMGTAIAVFLFLPYCHLQRGNIVVDLFLSWAPPKVQLFFDAVSALLLAGIAGGLAWRMTLGGVEMYHNSQVTYILALPVWPFFPLAVLALALLATSCLYTAFRDICGVAR